MGAKHPLFLLATRALNEDKVTRTLKRGGGKNGRECSNKRYCGRNTG